LGRIKKLRGASSYGERRTGRGHKETRKGVFYLRGGNPCRGEVCKPNRTEEDNIQRVKKGKGNEWGPVLEIPLRGKTPGSRNEKRG